MKIWKALGSGLIGAGVMTLIHQAARKITPHAPRLDVLGMRAIVKTFRGMDAEPPRGEALYDLAFVGDLASNAALFSLAAVGDENAPAKGALIGASAGLASVALPSVVGLGRQPNEKTPTTQVLTVAWYVLGGLAAGLAYQALRGEERD